MSATAVVKYREYCYFCIKVEIFIILLFTNNA